MCFFRRAAEAWRYGFVVGNQIDLAAYAAGHGSKAQGVFHTVIDASKHDVLEKNALAALWRPGLQGTDHALDIVSGVDGHDVAAHRVGGGVQAPGQVGGAFVVKAFHHRGKPHGGHGDFIGRNEIPVFVREYFHRLFDGIEVVQWLAHAHHDDIGDAAASFGQKPPGKAVLFDDFPCFQIAFEPQPGGETKSAPHFAAHLGGQTQGYPGQIGNQHALHRRTIGKGELYFHRAVGGFFVMGHGAGRQVEHVRQTLAKLFGQIRHGGEIVHMLLVQPGIHLFGPERGLFGLFELRRKGGQRQRLDVGQGHAGLLCAVDMSGYKTVTIFRMSSVVTRPRRRIRTAPAASSTASIVETPPSSGPASSCMQVPSRKYRAA